MLVGFSALAGTLWCSKTVGTVWNMLEDVLVEVLTQLGVRGSPQFLSSSPPKGPKWSKNGQNLTCGPKRLEWHGMSYRTSWLRFWHIWECVCAGVSEILAQERPKRAKMPKYDQTLISDISCFETRIYFQSHAFS